MNFLSHHLQLRIKKVFIPTMLVLLLFQNQSFASDDKSEILGMSNWALINFPLLFVDTYEGPFDGFGYRYTCFTNNNCIGTQAGNVDVLINGEILAVGSVEAIISMMRESNNGILNLSSSAVDDGIIPSVYSPAFGKALEIGGQLISITWQIIVNEGTDQQEICDFSIIINSAEPSTVTNATFTRTLFGGSEETIWSLFSFSLTGIPGMIVDTSDNSLKISEDVELPIITLGSDDLIIIKDSKLLFSL